MTLDGKKTDKKLSPLIILMVLISRSAILWLTNDFMIICVCVCMCVVVMMCGCVFTNIMKKNNKKNIFYKQK